MKSVWAVLRRSLAHPLAHGLELDNPELTLVRRDIIRGKPFLKSIYLEWYEVISSALPAGDGLVLELGSGAGFLQDSIPDLIASDVSFCPQVDAVLDAAKLPFREAVLRAIVMTDVLHHIPTPREFFQEAARCVRPGGCMVMIEPWVTPWARLIWARLHHEPFAPDAETWELGPGGPLSTANSALPWIIFERDRAVFERDFPQWNISRIRPCMPFRYLASGGISLRSLAPMWSYCLWRKLEQTLEPWATTWAMFAEIVLRRNLLKVTGTEQDE